MYSLLLSLSSLLDWNSRWGRDRRRGRRGGCKVGRRSSGVGIDEVVHVHIVRTEARKLVRFAEFGNSGGNTNTLLLAPEGKGFYQPRILARGG